MHMNEILKAAVELGASDIHIVPERPPFFRINGKMRSLNADTFTREDTHNVIHEVLTENQIDKFKEEGELDASLTLDGVGRFRVNVLEQKDGLGAVLRVIPKTPWSTKGENYRFTPWKPHR